MSENNSALQGISRLITRVKALAYRDARVERRKLLASLYIRGNGIEIGALHMPLAVPAGARVSYVDRHETGELRRIYPELNDLKLVHVDIVDDGETLRKIAPESQDFVIANHFLEHCENPLMAIESFMRVLRHGGILYMAVPDKRFTFDKDRPVTDIGHLRKDYDDGPAQSRAAHYLEYASLVDKSENPGQRARSLMDTGYSIHFHVWTQAEVLELLVYLKKELSMGIEVKEFLACDIECICILQKA